jgi:hypothetical protein
MKRRVCAVLVTAALAGCGTGGGGSGGPSGPVSPPVSDSSRSDSGNPPASTEQFPTLSTVKSTRATAVITSRDHEHFRDRLSAPADGAGNFTLRVNDPNIGPYSFTVNLPPNTALGGSREGIDFSFTSLNYSAAGWWSKPPTDSVNGSTGAGVVGVMTPVAQLPKTGTATYSGEFVGRYTQTFSSVREKATTVRADARSVANFGTGAVSFETANSRINNGEPNAHFDLVGSMTGAGRTDQLRGTVSTKLKSAPMSGDIRAFFFGPASETSAPPELGGSVSVKGPGSTTGGADKSMVGGFVMKR